MEENKMVNDTNVVDNMEISNEAVEVLDTNSEIVDNSIDTNSVNIDLPVEELPEEPHDNSIVTVGNMGIESLLTVDEENINPDLRSNPECIVKGNNYRITVLSERLIRLEYHPEGIFNDFETELVKCRNFNKPDFTIQEDNKYLVIKTNYFTLSYTKGKSFDGGKFMPMSNLKISLNGTDREWYYNHPEVRNFKGNIFSLDGVDTNGKPEKGLYSADGFASINDSLNYVFDKNGKIYSRDGKGIDIYLFMYNNDYDLALKDYYKLTGSPLLIPRYALGNWWSRDLDYTDKDIDELVENFEKNNIPLSILLLDKGWHNYKLEDGKEVKSGFSFNKNLISEPETFIKNIHDKNIHIGVKIDPSDGIYPFDEHYSELATKFSVTDNKIIAFDPLNPVLLDSIYQIMISPLTKMGIDFFWNDMDNSTMSIKDYRLCTTYLYDKIQKDDAQHEMVLARNPMIAAHRYPVTYTGKTTVGWDMLRKNLELQRHASNIGVVWISNDVAGNYGGVEEEEFYVRSVEQAAFGPIMRFNAPRGRYYRKEPWRWNAKTLEIVGRYLRLRHRLIPYLYSEAYDYSKNGKLFIKPLYYNTPWVYDDSDYKNEYFFGKSMLVAPILKKKDMIMSRTEHRVYIPDGIWYDFMTGKKFPGNKEYKAFYRDEDYPIFVKRGGIIPLCNDLEKTNFTGNPEKFEIHIFPGESNTFNIYEDYNEEDSKYLITQIDYNYLPSNYTVIIRNIDGQAGVVPEKRSYKIRFRNTKKADNVICYFNDSQIKTISYIDDSDFVVEVNDVPSMGQLTLNCKGKDIEIDAIRFINDDIDNILLDLPINTVLKEQISTIMFSSLPIKRKRIEIRKLRKYNLGGEYIRLFLKLLAYIETI